MEELIVIPYIKINDQWTLPDIAMQGLYHKMVEDGTDKTFFYSGTVTTGEQFILACKQRGTYLIIIIDTESKPIAIVCLKDFQGKCAYGHFCMFKSSWGKKTISAGKKAIEHFFSLRNKKGEAFIDVMIGIIPEDNVHAIEFVKKLGFTIMGIIPRMIYKKYENKTVGALFSYIERGE